MSTDMFYLKIMDEMFKRIGIATFKTSFSCQFVILVVLLRKLTCVVGLKLEM